MQLSLRHCLFALAAVFLAAAGVSAQQNTPGVIYRDENVLLNETQSPPSRTPETSVSYPSRQLVPVPTEEMLDLDRPRTNFPALLEPKDFFGRVKRPSIGYYDPFNSSLLLDGQPTAPGDQPMLKERSRVITIQPWAMPTISVAEEVWVTLILMREGELVYHRSQIVGSKDILEVQRSTLDESPYLFLRAVRGRTDNSGNYLRTTLDIEVVDKQKRVFVYKFDVQVVPLSHPSYYPTLKVDMNEAQLPPVYGREGSRYSDSPIAGAADARTGLVPPLSTPPTSAAPGAAANRASSFQAGSVQFATGQKFTRENTQKLLPIMIGMAKAYDEATKAGAKGYEPKNILPFNPSTVVIGEDGKPRQVTGKIPAFHNPYDGQVYFVLRSYFFPRYDAILYDVSMKNRSNETLWWDYSELGIIPGFLPSDGAESPTVVSPEFGETTPPGKANTFWVLVQGRGWSPTTPIRLSFPMRGMESKTRPLVLPHAQTPRPSGQAPISILRSETFDITTAR